MTANDGTATPLDAEPAAALGEPVQRVGKGFLALFGFLNFALYLTVMMPALFSLPYKIQLLDPASKAVNLGMVAAVGAVVSLIAGPLAGVLSDRTHSRWGRRRPWMIGGVVVAAAGAMIVAIAPSLPIVLIGWVIVCIGGSGVSAGVTPIVAEKVPESQRGSVGAIAGVATQLAGVLGYTIGGLLTFNALLLFGVPYLVLGIVVLLWACLIPDSSVELPTTTVAQTFRLMVFNPRMHRDFGFLWLGKLLMQIALAFLTTYQLYYLGDRLGFTPEEAGQKLALVGGIGILVTMTFAVVSGTLSDKLRRRRVFVITAAVLAAVGLALMAFASGFGPFFGAVMFILGGAGMFGAVDVAMASDLVPDREQAGRWMTIYNLAATLPTAIAPVFGAFLLTLGSPDGTNYTALFISGAVIAVGTAFTTLAIKGVR
ncbi:MFS transporter [Microbacterium fluvii]|uniref:MFS transporter n=1 Tax=Microbacterium fluvii TaxID=415215 RepID=A0ABW2HEA8_9MICO|nr:MFS transporter [Microbacterium fluvii]MCU4673043.1 MFS transporter [Microbacterium fluvii]